MRILLAVVIVSLVIPFSVLADPEPEDHIDWDTVFGPFDRVEQGAPDCDEPFAERPCVEWSYYRFQGTPHDWTFESARSADGSTIYMGLNTIPDPKLDGSQGRPLTVHAVDAETGDELWLTATDPYHRPIPTDMVLSDDGSMLAFSAYFRDNGTCAAYAFDTATGAELWSYEAAGHFNCRGIDVTPDGSRFYLVGDTWDGNGNYRTFYHALDRTDGSLIGQAYWRFDFQHHHDILALDNGSVYVTGQVTLSGIGGDFVFLTHFVDDVFAWDARIPAVDSRTWDGRQPLLSPNGDTVYFGDHQNTAAVDAVTGVIQWDAQAPAEDVAHLPDLVLSPDGSQLVVLDGARLRILDSVTGATAWSVAHEGGSEPRDAVFSADGSLLWVLLDDDDVVQTYDAQTGARLSSIAVDGGTPSRVFLTDDGFLVSTVNGGLFSQGVHLTSYVL